MALKKFGWCYFSQTTGYFVLVPLQFTTWDIEGTLYCIICIATCISGKLKFHVMCHILLLKQNTFLTISRVYTGIKSFALLYCKCLCVIFLLNRLLYTVSCKNVTCLI